ncbi:unnamed protein product [Gongylonema pulchrum]|uniref:Uncharacterized protein n=1 Tax=Gongylonema pulchrum TaxID=637853 RepID=A0A183EIS5_9BILA|nr:unnamed protein product [Gongylonema pulchrum]
MLLCYKYRNIAILTKAEEQTLATVQPKLCEAKEGGAQATGSENSWNYTRSGVEEIKSDEQKHVVRFAVNL